MDLMMTDALAREILRVSRKDETLLRALAADWIDRIAPEVLHPYLLSDGVAVELLAQRLQKNPQETLDDLGRLIDGKGPARKPAAKRRAAKTAPSSKRAVPSAKSRKRKRHRLSAGQVEQLKRAVTAFLGQHGWANRKQISAAAQIPTPSLYNRVVGELRDDGLLVSRGEKAMRVYALKSGRSGPKTKRTAKKSKKAKARSKSKR